MKDDLISRKAVMDICNFAIDLWHGQLGEGIVVAVRKRIEQLPPVQPQQTCEYWDSESKFCALCRPSAQPETHDKRTETHACDCVERQAAIDALMKRDKELRNINWYDKPFAEGECKGIDYALEIVNALPSAQQDIIKCKDCKWCENANGSVCKNPASWVVATDRDFGCVLAERRTDG